MIPASPIARAEPDRLAKHHRIKTNGIEVHVAEAGNGEPILFVHGFPENWYSWHNQMAALSPRFRTLAVDLRGYGLSDFPESGYDAGNAGRDLLGVLDALGIERVNAVAHDWGALILWRLAFAHPERFKKIAVLNTPHLLALQWNPIDRPESLWKVLVRHPQFIYLSLFMNPRLARRVFESNPERFLKRVYRYSAFERRLPMSEADLRYLANLYARPDSWKGPFAYYATLPESTRQSADDVGKKLTLPVLLLLGDNDPILRPKLAEPMREMLSNLTIQHIPQAGHWPQIEQPGEVNKALGRFFGA
ncbi:MAG: alpha/beta hydrolase [Bdellovibrionota bacterium]